MPARSDDPHPAASPPPRLPPGAATGAAPRLPLSPPPPPPPPLVAAAAAAAAAQDFSPNHDAPSLAHRVASQQVVLAVAALCKTFLGVFSNTTVHGLPRFQQLLEARSDPKARRRGLVTVSNHISVLDDPLMWSVLPLSFTAMHAHSYRFSFGSHDICFKHAPLAHFFSLGRVLPMHRSAHSAHGGLFQPTMTEGVRLLGRIDPARLSYTPYNDPSLHADRRLSAPSWPHDCVDPFSSGDAPAYPSYPGDVRWYLAPSRYASNSFSWIHIFPEGMIHQADNKTMRYFKWGVARLILEPEVCPDVVPIWIEGTDDVMHESRGFPRFLPRAGKAVSVAFGRELDVESVFGDLRARWRKLRDDDCRARGLEWSDDMVGLVPESLRASPEAVNLRVECTRRVREAVLEVRRSQGHVDEDPKCGVVETWLREGPQREGLMDDGTWIKDT